jgi:hypothetical protein
LDDKYDFNPPAILITIEGVELTNNIFGTLLSATIYMYFLDLIRGKDGIRTGSDTADVQIRGKYRRSGKAALGILGINDFCCHTLSWKPLAMELRSFWI